MQTFTVKTKEGIAFNSFINIEESNNTLEAITKVKSLSEQVEDTKVEIFIRLKKLELLIDDKEFITNYRNKVQELIEKINKQIKDEQANEYRVIPKLFLYSSFYYKNLLDKIREAIDNNLLRYNFLKKLKLYTIDKINLDDSIRKIIDLKMEYEKIKYLFSENDNINIIEVLINNYFDVILLEIENKNDSDLFQILNTREKQKLQLLLFNKLEEFIREEKLSPNDIVELSNIEFTINDFKIYIRLLKEKMASKNKLENISNEEISFTNFSIGLLKKDYILYGNDSQEEFTYIIKKYGLKCATTDFAILLGGEVSNVECVGENRRLIDRTASWFLDLSKQVYKECCTIINEYGKFNYSINIKERFVGVRPTVPYSSIKEESLYIRKNEFNIDEISFGEYVGNIVDKNEMLELEDAFNNNLIHETGKKYTTDSVYIEDKETTFNPREHIEYEYKGKKYIRFIGDKNGEGKRLSNGEIVKVGEVYWLKVEPIIWLADEVTNLAISKVILMAGLQYNTCDFDKFEETSIYRYLINYFANDIIPSKDFSKNDKEKAMIKTL